MLAPDDEGSDDPGADEDTGTGIGGDAGIGDNITGGGNASADEQVVAWTQLPEEVNGTEPISIGWAVDLSLADAQGNASAGNETSAGGEANATGDGIDETGVAYGFQSVPTPTSPADYDQTAGVENNTTSPNEFSTELQIATDNDAVYLRAYAFADGTYHWSEEAILNVTGNATAGEEHEIEIRSGTLGFSQFARFDPDSLTINVGDSVVWNNTDSNTHTIEVTGPEDHQVGDVAAGEASTAVVFATAGEYTFECTRHPDTMDSGTITVEA